jgi:hypothetical protein
LLTKILTHFGPIEPRETASGQNSEILQIFIFAFNSQQIALSRPRAPAILELPKWTRHRIREFHAHAFGRFFNTQMYDDEHL